MSLSLLLSLRFYKVSFEDCPVKSLIGNPQVNEILIQSYDQIFIEQSGEIVPALVSFSNHEHYEMYLQNLCTEAGIVLSMSNAFPCFQFMGCRFQIAIEDGDYQKKIVSIRKQVLPHLDLAALFDLNWCTHQQLNLIRDLIRDRANILFVGPTSSGKTTALSACLQSCLSNERVIALEDTQEILLPNLTSVRLVSRDYGIDSDLPNVTLGELVKHSLRLRPDRLVLGEIRGSEAKDFMMALSTGHSGSMASIHASSAEEALLRLEMLVQMGAPDWSLATIRRLLKMSLQILVTLGNQNGKRTLRSIHRVFSLEPEAGLILERLDQAFDS